MSPNFCPALYMGKVSLHTSSVSVLLVWHHLSVGTDTRSEMDQRALPSPSQLESLEIFLFLLLFEITLNKWLLLSLSAPAYCSSTELVNIDWCVTFSLIWRAATRKEASAQGLNMSLALSFKVGSLHIIGRRDSCFSLVHFSFFFSPLVWLYTSTSQSLISINFNSADCAFIYLFFTKQKAKFDWQICQCLKVFQFFF